MFESLSDRLGEIFTRLRKRGALSESDVAAALREVRVALLEADVALPVVKSLIEAVHKDATGVEVLGSVSPAQMVIKVVHDRLVAMLGAESAALNVAAAPPAAVLMVGLQGSGKTTTSAKIALKLTKEQGKKVLMAGLDTRRPAAQDQLRVLGEQAGIATLPVMAGQLPIDIARRAMEAARLQAFDIVILDTAGRQHVDDGLMDEAAAIRDAVMPAETLLVADALTGQDAVNLAAAFKARLDITGVVLTRIDGDARGGAALSIRAVAGCPIKLLGTGEKLDALEGFHPERLASRILGMGDVVSLVEKAAETIDEEEAARIEAKLMKGRFDLDDLALQLGQMRRMGGMEGVMALLPGVGKAKRQMAEAAIDDGILRRQVAIIQSMTAGERKNAKLLSGSRKRRVAAGSGTAVQDVNRLLKQYKQLSGMVKKVGKLGKKGIMRHGLPGMSGLPHMPMAQGRARH
jgi:signal recognition particle subunit SRP54